LLAASAASTLGAGAVVLTEQSAGGDDFAWYAERVPSTYARLGVHDPSSTEPRRDLHASTFDIDERAIAIGVRVLVHATLAAMTSRPTT
jgi:amidohydrolase